MSTSPVPRPARIISDSLIGTSRDSCRTTIGKLKKRSTNTSKCCRDSRVVGTKTIDCKLDLAARNNALIITSVLPNATSPTIRRSLGIFFVKSFIISLIEFS